MIKKSVDHQMVTDPSISTNPSQCNNIYINYITWRGTRWRGWLRHCAARCKVTGSIPDGVIGIFHWYNPFGRTMIDSASDRNEYREYFLGSKGGRREGLNILMYRLSLNLGASPSWNLDGLSRPVTGIACFTWRKNLAVVRKEHCSNLSRGMNAYITR
jgi:hypothetical protein